MTELTTKTPEQKPLPRTEQTAPIPETQSSAIERVEGNTSVELEKNITLSTITTTASTPQQKIERAIDPLQQKIESIMSDGLKDIYLSLSQIEQMQVKKAGEETANKIIVLLQSTSIHIIKILKLIRNWLTHIPGLNSYFIEQEAAIKTSKIIKLK